MLQDYYCRGRVVLQLNSVTIIEKERAARNVFLCWIPSNGVISSPFSPLTNFFSKKCEGNPMFKIFLDLSKFGVLALPKSFYNFADS
jgi:hypothetical protein